MKIKKYIFILLLSGCSILQDNKIKQPLHNKIYTKKYTDFTKNEVMNKKIGLYGSFKCYAEFIERMNYFESMGAEVLFPIRSKGIVNLNVNFRLFKEDDASKTPKQLQQGVFDKTRKYADIIYIVNPTNCIIGDGTASEIGYVLALNDIRSKQIKIYAENTPVKSHIMAYAKE